MKKRTATGGTSEPATKFKNFNSHISKVLHPVNVAVVLQRTLKGKRPKQVYVICLR